MSKSGNLLVQFTDKKKKETELTYEIAAKLIHDIKVANKGIIILS